MDLRRLGYFLAVVDHGGVTPAAAALHIAQPSLSQAIRGLERELRVDLFRRDGHRLTLTPAGEALVGPARQALRSLAAAQAAVGEVVGLAAGRLDVAVHDLLAVDPVAPVLAGFHGRHPGVEVALHSPRDEDEMVNLVRDGRCELGLTFLPVHAGGLRVRELGWQDVWVVLPPGAVPDPADPMPVPHLDGLPVVIGVDGYEAVSGPIRAALRAGGVRLRLSVHCRHQDAVLPLVLAGAGFAFVNRWYARRAAELGAPVRRLDPPIWGRYGLLSRPGGASPAATAFIEMLVDETAASAQPPPGA